MRFHIVNIEPKGFPFGHFLDYYCRLICLGLESLGHDCSIGRNSLDNGRVNILMGAHALTSPNDVELIASRGNYIVAQSEILRPDGVNKLGNKTALHEVYLPLLMGALAVWEGVPGNLAPLRQMGINACLLLGGYHPGLEEIVQKRNPDIDFSFFGSVTPHRHELFGALRQRGHQVAVIFDARRIYRDDLIARTKVNLAPHQGADMNHLAYGRICYLLNNRSLVVVEASADQAWLEQCFPWASTEEWVELCEQTLLRQDRQQIRDEYYQRFRQLPFTDQMERLLDETFDAIHHGPPAPHHGGQVGGESQIAFEKEPA